MLYHLQNKIFNEPVGETYFEFRNLEKIVLII